MLAFWAFFQYNRVEGNKLYAREQFMATHDPLRPAERESSTGVPNPNVDMSNWRVKRQKSRIKFDDDAKEIYLRELLEHGKKYIAARMAGVCPDTAIQHAKDDPEFAAEVTAVIKMRAERIVKTLEKQGLEVYYHPIHDKDGNEVGQKEMRETPLRNQLLKRYDPEYKDRIDVTSQDRQVGVIVVPQGLTLEQVLEKYGTTEE